jgi:hypothetical protein
LRAESVHRVDELGTAKPRLPQAWIGNKRRKRKAVTRPHVEELRFKGYNSSAEPWRVNALARLTKHRLNGGERG